MCIDLKKAKAKARNLSTKMNIQTERMKLLQKSNQDLEKEINEFHEEIKKAKNTGEILENELDIYADREKQLFRKLGDVLGKFEKLRIENSVNRQLKDKQIAESKKELQNMENETTETIARLKSSLKIVQKECKMLREYVDHTYAIK